MIKQRVKKEALWLRMKQIGLCTRVEAELRFVSSRDLYL